jgi:hypothetical protein
MYFTIFYRKSEYSDWKQLCIVRENEISTSLADQEISISKFFQDSYTYNSQAQFVAKHITEDVLEQNNEYIRYEMDGLRIEAEKYLTDFKEKIQELDYAKKQIERLTSKKRTLEREIRNIDEVLTRSNNLEAKFTKRKKNDFLTKEEAGLLNLPEPKKPIYCPGCREIVIEKNKHYSPSNGWPCKVWNHP